MHMPLSDARILWKAIDMVAAAPIAMRSNTTLALNTSTAQVSAHGALQTLIGAMDQGSLPSACWELLAELIYNIYEHASDGGQVDTPWGLEIAADDDEDIELRVFDGGVGLSPDKLACLFDGSVRDLPSFRGQGLLALKRYVVAGTLKSASLSSAGATIRLEGAKAQLLANSERARGVRISAVCRRQAGP